MGKKSDRGVPPAGKEPVTASSADTSLGNQSEEDVADPYRFTIPWIAAALGKVVKREREQKQIQTSDLAFSCMVEEDYIERLERGEIIPGFPLLFVIGRVLYNRRPYVLMQQVWKQMSADRQAENSPQSLPQSDSPEPRPSRTVLFRRTCWLFGVVDRDTLRILRMLERQIRAEQTCERGPQE